MYVLWINNLKSFLNSFVWFELHSSFGTNENCNLIEKEHIKVVEV